MWSQLELLERWRVQALGKPDEVHENLYRFSRFKGWQNLLVLLYLWNMNFRCSCYNFFGV